MSVQGIRTTHELADYLEKVAQGLRLLPDVSLEDNSRPAAAQRIRHHRSASGGQSLPMEEIRDLANRIRKLSREEAEERLSAMTVASIRALAPLVDIRVPSKATKDEQIETLLLHLFDIPRGAEVIETLRANRQHLPTFSVPEANRRAIVQKFIANGEDLTDLFYWLPPRASTDVRRSRLTVWTMARKVAEVEAKFRQWGEFKVEFNLFGGKTTAWYVRLDGRRLPQQRENGIDLVPFELRVVRKG